MRPITPSREVAGTNKGRWWPHQVILQKVEELRFLERAGRSLAQAALQYLLSYPVVSTIIAGAKRVEQLEMNAGASNGMGLEEEELERVKAILGRDGDLTR